MASKSTFSSQAVNVKADAQAALLDDGFVDLYTAPRPAAADDAITTQTRLCRLTFGSPAFVPAVGGAAVAHPIQSDPSAAATGTAAWCRLVRSDASPVCDGWVGTSGCNVNLSSVSVIKGGVVALTSLVLTESKG